MKTTITAGLSWIGTSDFQDTSDKVYSVTSEGLVQARQVNLGFLLGEVVAFSHVVIQAI